MKNKAIYILIGIAILTGYLLFTNQAAHEANTLSVGFILPLTGDAATYGEDARNAANLAINDAKKDIQVSIVPIYEDSQLNGAIAASAANKLLDVDKVDAIVTFSSGETLSVCPIAKSKNIVLLTSGSSPAISECGGSTFRNYPSDIYQGKVLAQKAIDAGYKKVSLVYINNDYGNGLKEEFLKNYKGEVISEGHKSEEKDFRTLVTKIKSQKPDAAILITHMAEGSAFLTQMDSLGVHIPVLGSEALKEDDLIAKIPAAMKKYLSVVSVSQYSGSEAGEFESEYKDKYGKEPGAFADYVYDNVMVLADAAKSCSLPDTSGCISSKIQDTHMKGATGEVSFDSRGDLQEKPYDLFIIEGDNFQVR